MQPVTTRRASGRRASLRARTVSIDSWRAASMKAQVLTTTTSASSGASAGTSPSASIVPVSLSESTWFFGQPRVSTQKDCATNLKATGRPNLAFMATIETINPTTGESIGSVPDMEDAQVRQAVQRARAAYRIWGRLDFGERREQLLRVRDLMLDRADDVVRRVCDETGKTPFEAMFTELFITADLIDFYARHGEKALRPQRVNTGPLRFTKRSYKVYEPLGVVAVISPWNYPFSLTMTNVVSALFAGNTVVLKPSEITPLVGVLVGELFATGCDYADVVEVVTGGGAAGSALIGAGVQKVCFTGSVATGKKVMAKAAETLTPVTLELGGKDPMIVLDDADVERAANGAVWGAFSNSGQTCIAIERAYVEAGVYDAFVDKVVAKTRAIRQGTATDDVGSMTFPPQVDHCERHVDVAVGNGDTD